MKTKFIPLFIVVALLSTCTPLAFAQQSASTSDWTAVQRLNTNARLVVKQKNGKELKGLMIEATDNTLTIDRDGKPVSIPRADVRQVHLIEGKAAKGKWALIGAGIGAGVGAGVGAVKYSPDSDDSELWIPVGLMFGTGIGAASGLLFGASKRKRTMVYAAY
ncbi:MAG TPA: hypothetical protein VM941_08530 [Pyrinomonadaceae bacterium]|nr:hypothetical protein [Pyrinomonadaceae bacterium]